MRAKSYARLQAEQLRQEQGLSYNEISALTGINKSTLSMWLRDIPLSPEQEARLQERLQNNRAAFAARALPINRLRHQRARQQAYEAGANIVANLPNKTDIDELALAMLYLGEGAKRNSTVQIANTDPDILRFFLDALKSLYQIEEDRVSFRLNLVEVARPLEKELIAWWRQQLNCTPESFRKTQFDARSRATQLTGNYHGVCTLSYNDVYLQQRFLGLARTYLQFYAGRLNKKQRSLK